MGIKSYSELQVWQKAIELVKVIYLMTEVFPKKEQYRLVDQMCRAGVSVASNIAEGSSRRSTKEFIRFLNISYGSLSELETQITIAQKLSYISQSTLEIHLRLTSELGKMLNGLINSLLKKLAPTEFRTLNSEL